MGYDLYLKKVNKRKLKEKTRFIDLNDLSFDDLEEIMEDSVNSFEAIFEKYFQEKGIHYRHGDEYQLSQEEFQNMKHYLEEEIAKYENNKSLLNEENNWTYSMMRLVYRHMCKWEHDLEDSEILFEHDC